MWIFNEVNHTYTITWTSKVKACYSSHFKYYTQLTPHLLEEIQYDRIIQEEEALVRLSLRLSLVRFVLRCQYYLVVRLHRSTVGDVRERQSLQIHTVVLVTMCRLDLFSPSRMHPAVARWWKGGLIVTSGHDCLIDSGKLLLLVAASVVLGCGSCVVDCEVVIWESNFVANVVGVDVRYFAVALSRCRLRWRCLLLASCLVVGVT